MGRHVVFGILCSVLLTAVLTGSMQRSVAAFSVTFPAPDAATRSAAPNPPVLGVLTSFGSRRAMGYVSPDLVRKQLDELGANSYRDGIVWASFRFPPDAPPQMVERRRIMNFLPVAGRSPLLVLGPPDQEPAPMGAPFTDAQIDQYSAFVKQVVEITRPYQPIYEIWNEFNLKVGHVFPGKRLTGEGDASDPRAAIYYAPLARRATQAAKAANPQAKVVVGAVGDDPDWAWTKAIVREGALEGADGLSVHLYNHCAPVRTATEMIERTEQLEASLMPLTGGREVPLYITEFGWPTPQTRCGLSLEQSAANFAQFVLLSATLPYLKGIWAYEVKDKGTNRQDIEQNFGLFFHDDRPKPAACFFRMAADIVREARHVEVKRPEPEIFVMRAVMSDHQIVLAWTTRPYDHVPVRFDDQPKNVSRMCGPGLPRADAVELTGAPVIARYDLSQAPTIALGN
ncbi:hypothetical protein K9U40_14715 [Xanthobacter autotrophicus]|uniref:hypothetical protein n=1 Tax=Xanthobacter TaxID=279 RepID=UPI0024AC5016|nr:hypothetical protein [Xanthobacter autotrophicus]MDI4665565.1 hypothetical protein [Xanthobacter autotrophicus]